MSKTKCCYNNDIPCCDARKILMFRDYVNYVVENNIPYIFYLSDNDVGMCKVDKDWCPHYREWCNKPKCRYNSNIICDQKYQLEEFYRQKSVADKAGQPYTFNADGGCPAKKDLCSRYLTNEKQR